MSRSDTYHAFMLDHAAGVLSPDMHLAAELHRLMTSEGAEAARLWDVIRDVLTETHDASDCASMIPEALEIIHKDYDKVRWKRGMSGAHYARTGETRSGAPVCGQLMMLEPGAKTWRHGHSALEATVVLEGAFADGHDVYERGDLVLGEPGLRHRPAAHGNARCVCFVARSKTPFWRMT